MTRLNQFVISNDHVTPLILIVEPEATELALAKDEHVVVKDAFKKEPVTIQFSKSQTGEPIVSIWPGDGELTVEKDGVDVLELVQNTVNSRSA
jgi:hypothetical protein